jgi:uridylate kinase
MNLAISLGGSLLTRSRDAENYLQYAHVLRKLKDKGHQLVVVCGGGRLAREFIAIASKLGASPRLQDRLGICTTHINALLVIAALGDIADPRIHRRASEVKNHLDGRILVGGGHLPGSSTDYRTVLFAKAIGADLIVNATDYGGVFDKDPRTHPEAKQYNQISYECLEQIIMSRFEQSPGKYGLFDLKATKLARRLHIPLVFIDGTDPEEIVRAVEGSYNGTLVQG